MFRASLTSEVGRSFSYRASSAAAASSGVMFPLSFAYTAHPAPAAATTRPATPNAVHRTHRRRRRRASPRPLAEALAPGPSLGKDPPPVSATTGTTPHNVRTCARTAPTTVAWMRGGGGIGMGRTGGTR
ncbi:hypothetical protein GCM10010304_49850 [Streptomyces roseoviolaceus]